MPKRNSDPSCVYCEHQRPIITLRINQKNESVCGALPDISVAIAFFTSASMNL